MREYFDDLEQERDVRAGTRSRGWTQEAAWPDETEPAIYLMHDEGESYPVGIDPETVDDAMLAIGEQHGEFFGTVAAGTFESHEDLTELTELFAASAAEERP